ncbi:mycofactocin system transcriptional regulator [Nocardia farcinica]|nr:mycofactocin system transcriptional regulator [Nocardia farcinica]MBA4856336.1 mycofactocin system transcriptional regulator [Nocardia farcinica]MBC9814157.1 mycofactocin system transcriptional regulator [Nocardia farcinica]MBF6232864.1 mycofactocin system transcriptional regulator [Nocardia farcinica]MBF6249032.1 mycofactocin system transcriptional regulator [Nocardia farcinica]
MAPTVTSVSDKINSDGGCHNRWVTTTRAGRPRGTTKRDLELIAMRLFTEQGFDNTTVEHIAAAAGISGRTFFRYFPSKAEVLWHQFDAEVDALRTAFATVPDELPMMTAVRRVVVNANTYRAEDVAELRTRMHLVATVPALAATAGPHYDAWERAVSAFAARRLGEPEDALVPLAVGRTTLAAARAAFDAWLRNADADLTVYLDQALSALERGFATDR